ncbi:MAG: hypothetical protein HUU55_11340 [Myxococcales bacterium]|nr:hypothetical protein [Myxococcales bacterium]
MNKWLGLFAWGLLLAPNLAYAGDILDARIDFPFADDNILRDAGEDRQSSPSASFTPPAGLRYTSFLHLGMYKSLDLGDHFVPEAALYLKLDVADKGTIRDDTSYIQLNYFVDGTEDRQRKVYLQLVPIDADRMRLGYHHEISWGGSDIFPKNFRGSLVPAAKLGIDIGEFYAFMGAKTALVRSAAELKLDSDEGNTTLFVERAYYGGFAGAGIQLFTPGLWLEINGGYFEKGTNNKAEVLGKPVHSWGLSGQLSYSHGVPIQRRIDLQLYRESPVRFDVTAPTVESTDVSFRFAAEVTTLMQTLADIDKPGSTKNEYSLAGFFSAAMQFADTRIHLDAGLRELSFITFNVPGFIPNAALPEEAEVTPEFSAVLSADHSFRNVGLTPFGQIGLQLPAVYEGKVLSGQNTSESLQGIRKVVVRGLDPGDWDILPEGEDPLPIIRGKAGLRYTYGGQFTLLGELNYAYDPNRSQIRKDEFGIAHRRYIDPNILGFGLLASMKF